MTEKVFEAFTRLDASDVNAYLVNKPITNAIINGAFDIWQRGTSFVLGSLYGPDRWFLSGAQGTVSRQSSGVPASSQFYGRFTSTGATGACDVFQYMESANTDYLRGKEATFQVKLRRSSTMNAGLRLRIDKSVTANAGPSATWVTIATATFANSDIPTGTGTNDWLKATLTVTVPNDGTANSLRVLFFQTAAITSGASWDFAEAQLEAGSVATPFKRNANSLQGELAACQRYYYRIGGETLFQRFGNGYGTSTTTADLVIPYPVPLRAKPTVSATVTNLQLLPDGLNVTGITTDTNIINSQAGAITATAASGLTLNRPYSFRASNSLVPFIEFIAEL
jgi:hypothetical protein